MKSKIRKNGLNVLNLAQMVHILLLVLTTPLSMCTTQVIGRCKVNAHRIKLLLLVSIGVWMAQLSDLSATLMSFSSSAFLLAISCQEELQEQPVLCGLPSTASLAGVLTVSFQKVQTELTSTEST